MENNWNRRQRYRRDLHNRRDEAVKSETSPERLTELAEDREWLVRAAAADNPNIPRKVRRAMHKEDVSVFVRYAASRPSFFERVFSRFSRRGSEDTSSETSDESPQENSETASETSDESPSWNPEAPSDTPNNEPEKTEEVLEDEFEEAKKNTTSPDRLAELATSKESNIRWAVVENPHTQLEVVIDLMRDKNQMVRKNAVLRLIEVEGQKYDIISDVSKETFSTYINRREGLIKMLAENEDRRIRYGIAISELTPPDVLADPLAKDKEPAIRAEVAKRYPDIPPEAVTILENDEESYIRDSIKNHPEYPVAPQETPAATGNLSDDLENRGPKFVIDNIDSYSESPKDIIHRLIDEGHGRVVVENPKNIEVSRCDIVQQLLTQDDRVVVDNFEQFRGLFKVRIPRKLFVRLRASH